MDFPNRLVHGSRLGIAYFVKTFRTKFEIGVRAPVLRGVGTGVGREGVRGRREDSAGIYGFLAGELTVANEGGTAAGGKQILGWSARWRGGCGGGEG